MICRLRGVTQRLHCPYGCTPQHVVPNTEAYGLLADAAHSGGDPYAADPAQIRAPADRHATWLQPAHAAMRPTDTQPRTTPRPGT